MVDIPSTTTPPPQAQQTQPSQGQSATPTPVPATVTDLPDKIQQLLRQIQVPATVSDVSNDGSTITIESMIGDMTLNLQIDTSAKMQQVTQQLTQQLMNLIDTQKPVTVVVQPGSPPTQAFIMMPPQTQAPVGDPQTVASVIQNSAVLQAFNQPPAPVTAGTILPAIVLPQNIVLPSNAAASPTPLQPQANPNQPSVPGNAQPIQPAVPEAITAVPVAPLEQLLGGNINLGMNLLDEIVMMAEAKAQQTIVGTQQQVINTAGTPTTSPAQTTPTPLPPTQLSNAPPLSQSLPQIPNSLAPQPATPLPPLAINSITTPPAIVVSPTVALQPTSQVSLQVIAVYPPAPSAAATPPSPSVPVALPIPASLPEAVNIPQPGPGQIIATVTGNLPNGQAILKAGDATLYIKTPIDAPVGTTLLIAVEQPKAPTLPITPQDGQSNIANLQQALSTLAQINPQLAQAVIENHIPQPTQALPGALLFFMSAFKQGNVKTWLGNDAVETLMHAGKYELVAKLAEDLTKAGQPANDPVVGEWKSYPVPLQANNQFQVMNFYVHQQGQREGGDKGSIESASSKKGNVRFL
ncbi:MAG TPA: hypothetical protein VFR09_05045, partial [Alphaproteobacteria bacterium]|nr:hypothetical protein [Alphaproteobacteria bacterium]